MSFTFDDVPLSAARAGAAVLGEHGVRGVFYVCGGLAGEPGPMGTLAGPAELRDLAARGHEIACHTYSHPDVGLLAQAAVEEELDRNEAALVGWGLPRPSNFAYPYGHVSARAKREVADRFAVGRSVRKGLITRGSDLAQAPAVELAGPRAEETAARWLERAQRAGAWVVFFTHDVSEEPSAWGTTPEALSGAVRTALERGFEVVTMAEGARRVGALS